MQVRISREFSLISLSLLPDKARFHPFLLLCLLLFASCSKQGAGAPQHVRVTMKKFAIEPAVIHVKQGSNVLLDVSTLDVQHGFQVSQLGINEPVQPGRPAVIPLDTSRKGQFKAECSIICGPGHDEMQ